MGVHTQGKNISEKHRNKCTDESYLTLLERIRESFNGDENGILISKEVAENRKEFWEKGTACTKIRVYLTHESYKVVQYEGNPSAEGRKRKR